MISFPFIWLSLSLSVGVLLRKFYAAPVIWPLLILHLPVLYGLRSRRIFWGFLCSGFLLLGILLGNLDYFPAPSVIEREIRSGTFRSFAAFSGEVISEPEVKINGRKETVSFVFKCQNFFTYDLSRRAVKKKADGNLQVFLNQPEKVPEIGEQLRIWGRLEGLPPLLNPGGFDYQRYLTLRGISGILNAYGPKSVKVLRSADPARPPVVLSKIRKSIRRRIEALFGKADALLIKALILGDRKNFKGELLADFLKTGTSHLIAISGLNISLAAGSLYLALIAVGVGQKKAAAAALLTACFQVAIAGFGIPIQRAGIMAGLAFGGIILERERSGMNIFFLAFIIITAADTRALESISFQLSFLSLFCLILFSQFWNRKWPWVEAWAASAAVLAGTFPVVLYHFNTFSPIGIVVNILGIPFFHLILLTAFFSLGVGGIPGIGSAMIWMCERFIRLGLGWIHFCAQADWGYYFLSRPSWTQMTVYYTSLGALLCLLKIKHRWRWYLRGALLTAWGWAAVSIFCVSKNEDFEMTVFAAGSNEIAHLQFGRENQWLINAGRTFPGDQAQWVVAPYLRSKGIKKLKGVVFTDYLKRHQAGLETLERDFSFQYRVFPKLWKKEIEGGGKNSVYVGRGDKIHMPSGDGIEIIEEDQGRLTLRVTLKEKKYLFLPRPNYRVFQRLAKMKNRKTDAVILFSDRDMDVSMLKAVLTLTQADQVIMPRVPAELAPVFLAHGIEVIDLSQRGAFQVQAREDQGQLKWIMRSFLPQG